jgi:hypothetical protein
MALRNVPCGKKFLAWLGFKIKIGKDHYLFKCPGCNKLRDDYVHGWPERKYVGCTECKIRLIL